MLSTSLGPEPDASLDAVFGALADPTRRSLMRRLRRGSATVSELAEPFSMSLPAVSKHLVVLRRAGLIEQRRAGREHRCRLVAAPLKKAVDWIEEYEQFWEDQLDSLQDFLNESHEEENDHA